MEEAIVDRLRRDNAISDGLTHEQLVRAALDHYGHAGLMKLEADNSLYPESEMVLRLRWCAEWHLQLAREYRRRAEDMERSGEFARELAAWEAASDQDFAQFEREAYA